MKKEELIQKAYEIAAERYAAVGVDTEKVLETMQDFHLSLHCWQADDVTGFEVAFTTCAYCVKAMRFNNTFCLRELLISAKPDLQPIRLS